MKKIFMMLVAAAMMVTFAACGGDPIKSAAADFEAAVKSGDVQKMEETYNAYEDATEAFGKEFAEKVAKKYEAVKDNPEKLTALEAEINKEAEELEAKYAELDEKVKELRKQAREAGANI